MPAATRSPLLDLPKAVKLVVTGGAGLSILSALVITEGISTNDSSHPCIPGILEFGIDAPTSKGKVSLSSPCAVLLFRSFECRKESSIRLVPTASAAAALLLIDPLEEVVGDDIWLMNLDSSIGVGSGS